VINGAQRILLFNKAAEKTFGYSWPEVKHERIELLIPERFRIGHEGMVHDYDRSGGLTRPMGVLGRIAGRRANGEEFPAEASISRTTDDGRTLFTVILRDITTQVQREEGLRRTEEQSRHAQRLEAVGRLAGGIAHDFNNILTIITNYCELIDLESANSPAIQTDIDAIR
ncbi:MAG: PAS domain S-box protein, partial [Gemmatimonadetes bacterium]|nr:PAS domain S-box protein [Gemmatimonadota bacterium]